MVATTRPAAFVQNAVRELQSLFPAQLFRTGYKALPTSTTPSFHSADPVVILSGRRVRPRRSLLRTRRGQLLAAAILSFVIFAIAVPILGLGGGFQEATRRARWRVGRETYIAAVVQNPVEGLLDPEPIRQKCNETSFQPGLVWHCDVAKGGIGTLTNTWLNCLRYALEAGATTIILPRINKRNQDGESIDLSELYDVDFFLATWKDVCPSMRAVLSDADVPNLTPVDSSPRLKPSAIGHFARKQDLIIDPREWRHTFDSWLAASAPPEAPAMSAEHPLRIVQQVALAEWNREAHAPNFANAFPRLFRHPPAIRRVAAVALWAMESSVVHRPVVADAVLFPHLVAKYAVAAASSAYLPHYNGSLVTTLGPHRVESGGFLGAHLREPGDLGQLGWPAYGVQATAYLDEAVRNNLSTVFLACGFDDYAHRFRADAARLNLKVVSAEDLLDSTPELAVFRDMSWDQRAIVDFEILLHSSYFSGFVRSRFSWLLAIRRSLLPEAGVPTISARAVPVAAQQQSDKEKYRDGLSLIVGIGDAVVTQGIWP